MINDGRLYRESAEGFINQNDPSRNSPKTCCRCCCSSFTLLIRLVIRNTIPLIFGLLSGIGIKWITEAINRPLLKSNLLLEISDVVSCSVTLLIYHGVNYLLNKCWPANPYHRGTSNFFQMASNDHTVDIPLRDIAHNASTASL